MIHSIGAEPGAQAQTVAGSSRQIWRGAPGEGLFAIGPQAVRVDDVTGVAVKPAERASGLMYEPERTLAVDTAETVREHTAFVGFRNTLVPNGKAITGTPFHKGPTSATTREEPPTQVSNRSKWQRRYVANLRISDTVVACGAVILGQYVRFGHTPTSNSYSTQYVTAYSALFATIWLLALAGFHTRSSKIIGIGIEEYRRVVSASCWTFVAIAIVTLLAKIDVARGYLAIALPAGTLGLVLSRCAWRGYVARRRIEGGYQSAVLAIGERDSVTNLVNELTRKPQDGYHVVGVCIPGYGPGRGENLVVNGRQIPIVGGETYALEALRTCGADTVAVAGTDYMGVRGIRRLMWELEPMDVDLVLWPGVMDVAVSRLVMRPIPGLPLLYIERPQYRGAKRFQKRALDFCFTLAALTVSLPILVIAAVAIKMTSRGPVFYSSERIGIDGKPFYMLKFRSMVQDADNQLESLLGKNESDGPLFKIRDDPRITPTGRILRRFSIDELPQFINVLRREMSVVGPRPPLRREVDAYDGDVRRRLLVKPGITGLWQISGRSDLTWDESIRLDLSYVDNWSMVGDLVIVAKTARAVLQRKGAY